jgi:hypothetical protein
MSPGAELVLFDSSRRVHLVPIIILFIIYIKFSILSFDPSSQQVSNHCGEEL